MRVMAGGSEHGARRWVWVWVWVWDRVSEGDCARARELRRADEVVLATTGGGAGEG